MKGNSQINFSLESLGQNAEVLSALFALQQQQTQIEGTTEEHSQIYDEFAEKVGVF